MRRNTKLSRSHRTRRSRLGFESLERRALLAGDVLANLNSGVLTLTGDTEANSLTVVQTGAGAYTVTGVGTTINGVANLEFTGLTGGLNIDLGAGADAFTFTGLPLGGAIEAAFSGAVNIQGGLGGDSIAFENANTTGDVTINGGDDDDTLVVTNVNSDANITIRAAAGADSVTVTSVQAGGNLAVRSGIGDDEVFVTDAIATNMTVRTGLGEDIVELDSLSVDGHLDVNTTLIVGGSAADADEMVVSTDLADVDRVDITASNSASFIMEVGAESDIVGISDFSATGNVSLHLSSGHDSLTLTTASMNNLTLSLGSADDTVVAIELSVAGNLAVDANTGSDNVTIGAGSVGGVGTLEVDSTIAGNFSALMGAGDDQLYVLNVAVSGSSDLRAHAGHDSVGVQGGAFAPLTIDTSTGDDSVGVGSAHLGGSTNIRLGAGIDELAVVSVSLGGDVSIEADASSDDVVMAEVTGSGNISAVLGAGNDKFEISDSTFAGDIEVNGQAGHDTISLETSTVTHATVNGSTGDDNVTFLTMVVNGNVNAQLDFGSDKFSALGLTATGDVTVDGSTGDDQISLSAVTADELFANLGAGHDSITAFSVLALATRVSVNGGTGNDTLNGKVFFTSPIEQFSGLETEL